jgi:hypothetical protein
MATFNKALGPVVEKWIGDHKDAGFDPAAVAQAAKDAIAKNKA